MTLIILTRLLLPTTSSTNSVRSLVSRQLIFDKFGEPQDVIRIKECQLPSLGSQDVLVQMLAAPINPSDINTIQGKYPVKIEFPSIPGNEGVGVVREVGKDVKNIHTGNKVIIVKPGQGTWRTLAIFKPDILRLVPDNLGLVEAATLTVNPCTAYRMLTDFKPVRKERQVVIQNGANSACGQYVIQLCKSWHLPNINIVRDRPDIKQLRDYLTGLGATYVLTEEELGSTDIFKQKKIDRPILALNCIGGKNSQMMLKQMRHSGTMVTFGGMSKNPVTIPTSAFIFKNLTLCGFWMTEWNKREIKSKKEKMIKEIIDLMCAGKLQAPKHQIVSLDSYKETFAKSFSSKGFAGCKYIFDLNTK